MKRAICTAVAAFTAFMPHAESSVGIECTCPAARKTGGWCNECNVGYVAGVKVESDLLFEALDAHGHNIDPKRIECFSCREALETDGFCDRCRMGFVNKLAYMSRLTYHVAKGEAKDAGKITCPTCRKNAEDIGWCQRCKVGMLRHVAIDNEDDFRHAAKAYAILQKAIKLSERCEICATALINSGRCPKCNIRYEAGERVEPKMP